MHLTKAEWMSPDSSDQRRETPAGKIEWDLHRKLRWRGVLWGLVAAIALGAVYVTVLALANSLEHAVGEFVRLWPWMTALVLGFALQVGLFAYAKAATRSSRDARVRGVAVSGGTSTLSMVACCAHHLTDVLPALVIGCRASQDGSGGAGAFSTKSSRGDIAFDLTPKVRDDGQLVVEVRANTHSGDLADLDLASVLTLHANGKTFRPTAATNLRGHHSSGTVTFALDDKPEQFAVTLASVRNMGEQRFEWP